MSSIQIYSLMHQVDIGVCRTVNLLLKYSEKEARNDFENLVLSNRRENSVIPVDDLFLVYVGSMDLSTSTITPSPLSFEDRFICSGAEFYSDDLEGDEGSLEVSDSF